MVECIEVNSLACWNPSADFKIHKIKRKRPSPGDKKTKDDVLIKIQYAGICHSDVHQGRAEWDQKVFYPMVPGHEIAGVVEAIGDNVTKYKIGDRVGVGCFVDSCRTCESCLAGEEQYCKPHTPEYSNAESKKYGLKNMEIGTFATYNKCIGENLADTFGYPDQLMYGGYSQYITVDQNYVCKVPDNLDLAKAGPLLCAGITMYSPLVHYGAKAGGAGFRTCIVGLGGLGDMGAKLAKAMGNEVTVLSTSERKRKYVEETLGCKFVCYNPANGADSVAEYKNYFHLIMCTISADFDINAYLPLVKSSNTLCVLGIPPNGLKVESFKLIARRIKLGGSLIGGIAETQEMLDFCGEHNLYSEIELIPAKDVNKAWHNLLENSNPAFRYVIDIENTLKEDAPEVEAPPKKIPRRLHENVFLYGTDDDSVGPKQKPAGAEKGA